MSVNYSGRVALWREQCDMSTESWIVLIRDDLLLGYCTVNIRCHVVACKWHVTAATVTFAT
jgi:hypothetical protein